MPNLFSGKHERKKPITKCRLYLHLMRIPFAIASILGIAIIVLFLVIHFIIYYDATRELYRTIFIPGVLAICFFLFFIILFSLLLLPQFRELDKQEKFLGTCFSDEMKQYRMEIVKPHIGRMYQIQKKNNAFTDWFVVVESMAFTAFRRDYIVKVEDYVEEENSYFSDMIILFADGERRTIRCSVYCISEFTEWISQSE
jgi:energy-coupling factor transporter transmembrane protein EcfT